MKNDLADFSFELNTEAAACMNMSECVVTIEAQACGTLFYILNGEPNFIHSQAFHSSRELSSILLSLIQSTSDGRALNFISRKRRLADL